MVNACLPESDPRPKVAEFVSNESSVALAGLVAEGMEGLLKVVIDEVRIQEPDSKIVLVDRDLLSDEDITFPKELAAFIDRCLSDGKKLNLFIAGDIPVPGWNMVLEQFSGRNIQVYYAAAACRQVPLCTKLRI
jgi:hypothetical protein